MNLLTKTWSWKMAHEARTDFSMTLGALFLLIVGARAWSADAWLNEHFAKPNGGKS